MTRMTEGDRDMVLLVLMVFAIPLLAAAVAAAWPLVWAFVKANVWTVFWGAVFLALAGVVLWVAWPRPIDQQRECCTDWPEDGE